MRPVALTWILQKNGLASSKGDAESAIFSGDVLIDGVRALATNMRLKPGAYLIQRNNCGELRVRVGQ